MPAGHSAETQGVSAKADSPRPKYETVPHESCADASVNGGRNRRKQT